MLLLLFYFVHSVVYCNLCIVHHHHHTTESSIILWIIGAQHLLASCFKYISPTCQKFTMTHGKSSWCFHCFGQAGTRHWLFPVLSSARTGNMNSGSKKGWKPTMPLCLRGKSTIHFCMFSKVPSAGLTPGNTPVYLNVYDLTPMNGYVYWAGLGIFHSGVEGTTLAFATKMLFAWLNDLFYSSTDL